MPSFVKVGISKLQIEMFIGINEYEKKAKQIVIIDIECDIDNLSFSIDDTLDYCVFESICTDLALSKKYDLLETFANDILTQLKSFKNIKSIRLKVSKPSAIKNADAAYLIVKTKI